MAWTSSKRGTNTDIVLPTGWPSTDTSTLQGEAFFYLTTCRLHCNEVKYFFYLTKCRLHCNEVKYFFIWQNVVIKTSLQLAALETYLFDERSSSVLDWNLLFDELYFWKDSKNWIWCNLDLVNMNSVVINALKFYSTKDAFKPLLVVFCGCWSDLK